MMSPRRGGTDMEKCEESSQLHSLVQKYTRFSWFVCRGWALCALCHELSVASEQTKDGVVWGRLGCFGD